MQVETSPLNLEHVLFCIENRVISEQDIPFQTLSGFGHWIDILEINDKQYKILSVTWVKGQALVFLTEWY